MFNRAKIAKPFLIGTLIHDLNEQNLITINDQTKNIIEQSDCESTLIVFKEKYRFDTLPKGYEFINNGLFYNLKVLKEGNKLELKSLVELDRENQDSIENLEKWAISLPNNNWCI